VTLKRVEANFLWTVARQGSVIYPREAVDTLKAQPMGTGPFTVSEWVRGDRIILVKNKDYWQKGLPKLDKVTYRFISDPNSALAALKSGDIDVSAFGLGPENVEALKKDGRFQVILGDTTNDVTLSMNNSKKPYSDKRVRLAITHAINKEEVLKGAMFGYGKILGSNVDPLNPYYVDVSKREPYDPAKAKKLLADAGYPNGFEATFKVAPQYYYTVRSAEIVVNQLAKVGIKAKIQQIEWGQWLAQVFCLKPCENPDYDIGLHLAMTSEWKWYRWGPAAGREKSHPHDWNEFPPSDPVGKLERGFEMSRLDKRQRALSGQGLLSRGCGVAMRNERDNCAHDREHEK
jgi:peptide/nickel transport system substrate-binding protein